jgi:hypothetical protein
MKKTFQVFFLIIAFGASINAKAAVEFWKSSDPLFQDSDGDGFMEFNNGVTNWMREEWGRFIPVTTVWFRHFTLDNKYYGLFMPDFINGTTFRSYCPGFANYQSTEPLFQRIGQLLLKPTQGFYILQRTSRPFKRILMNESELKRGWFIVKDGKEVAPKEDEVAREDVYLRIGRNIHKLMAPVELKIPRFSTYPSHDHKIGCILK